MSATTGNFLVTGATDGVLAIWERKFQDISLVPAKRIKVHQNAVKSIQILKLATTSKNDSTYIILTGGDDNGLAITRLDISAARNASLQTSTLLIPRAHAAALTTLVAFECDSDSVRRTVGEPNEKDLSSVTFAKIITTGNDQRLKCWQVEIDAQKPGVEGVHVRRTHNEYSPIADAASMDILIDHGVAEEASADAHKATRRQVVVCGVGMQVWEMSQKWWHDAEYLAESAARRREGLRREIESL